MIFSKTLEVCAMILLLYLPETSRSPDTSVSLDLVAQAEKELALHPRLATEPYFD